MQDDDIYPADLSWLNYGLEMLKKDPKLVVVGFAGGTIRRIRKASDTFTQDALLINGTIIHWVIVSKAHSPNVRA